MSMIIYKCVVCGKDFQRKSARKSKGRYCSRICYKNRIIRKTNIENDIVFISLTKDKVAMLDKIDADLSNFNWLANHNITKANENWYAGRRVGNKHEHMHRVILERILGRLLYRHEDVDHINNNGLDNRRLNLRVATRSENMQNKRKSGCMNGKNTTSAYKGVNWHKSSSKWISRIRLNGVRKFLGYFKNEKEAAMAYNQAAKEFFGEFAQLNEVV